MLHKIISKKYYFSNRPTIAVFGKISGGFKIFHTYRGRNSHYFFNILRAYRNILCNKYTRLLFCILDNVAYRKRISCRARALCGEKKILQILFLVQKEISYFRYNIRDFNIHCSVGRTVIYIPAWKSPEWGKRPGLWKIYISNIDVCSRWLFRVVRITRLNKESSSIRNAYRLINERIQFDTTVVYSI